MINNLITEHLDIWTSSHRTKSTVGRGKSSKLELHGINKLRALILELAVRGKLVLQNSEDEPASVLLERIASEKARLVKEKKIKRQRPLPAISDAEKPFELPKGWQWVRLGNLGETNIGLTYKPSNVTSQGTPVLRSSNIQKGKIDLTDLVRVSGIDIKDGAFVEDGDLLICARNGSRALVGKTAQIIKPSEPMAFGAFMAIYRSCANSFIELFLNSPVFRRNLDGVSTTTINQITQNNLRSTVAPVPPMQEWQRIITKANELMALCDQLEQEQTSSIAAHQTLVETLLTTLTDSQNAEALAENWALVSEHFDTLFTTEASIDQLKQTILQLAVMGRLVPQNPKDEPASALMERIAAEKALLVKEKKIKRQKPLPAISDAEKPFELPDGWEWSRLGNYSHIFSGNAFKSSDFQANPGIKTIKITNAGVGTLIKTEDYLPSSFLDDFQPFVVRKNDLILALTRPYISSGLKVSLCPDEYDNSLLNQRVAAIRVFENAAYAFLFLQSPCVLNLYRNRFSGSGLQPNLKMSDVTELVIAIPPKAEQHHIVTKVNKLMTLCDHLKQMVQQANTTQSQLTDAIVEQALNPEPVNNAERDAHILRRVQDEPGSVAYS